MHFHVGGDNIRRLLAVEAYTFLSLAVYRFEISSLLIRATAIGSLQLGQEYKSISTYLVVVVGHPRLENKTLIVMAFTSNTENNVDCCAFSQSICQRSANPGVPKDSTSVCHRTAFFE
jgi:hypothetical protein